MTPKGYYTCGGEVLVRRHVVHGIPPLASAPHNQPRITEQETRRESIYSRRNQAENSGLPALTDQDIETANEILKQIRNRHILMNSGEVQNHYNQVALSLAKKREGLDFVARQRPGYSESLAYLQHRIDTYEEYLEELGLEED